MYTRRRPGRCACRVSAGFSYDYITIRRFSRLVARTSVIATFYHTGQGLGAVGPMQNFAFMLVLFLPGV